MKECIVVLGMHRSGTSVLSGLVSAQGFYLGADEMPVREDNPKGFFENMKVYRLNQSILEDYKTSWDDYFFTVDKIKPNDFHEYLASAKTILKEEFGPAKRIFIKDPRMCLLFPLWEKALLDSGYTIKVILAYRSPMEVGHSLKVRNEMALEKSLLMWSHYFFQAEISSRPYERLLVHYSADFQDLEAFVNRLSEFLQVEVTDEVLERSKQLYTTKLTHHKSLEDNLSDAVPSYLIKLIKILSKGDINLFNKLDAIESEFYNSQSLFLYNDVNLNQRIGLLESDLSAKEGEIKLILKDLERAEKEKQRSESQSLDELRRKEQEIEKSYSNCRKLEESLEEIKNTLKSEKQKRELLDKTRREQLSVGNELFLSIYHDKAWKNKFKRILKESKYFKIKKAVMPFANNKNKTFLQDKIEIIESGLFSSFYYLTNHPQAWKNNVDPLNFYNKHGWKAGHNPGPHFNTREYLSMYEDVAQMGVNPLLHYIRYGRKEGRFPMLPRDQNQQASPVVGGLAAESNHAKYHGPTKGSIDGFCDGVVSGWLLAQTKSCTPIIKVNGIPTLTEALDQGVLDENGISQHGGGFKCRVISSVEEKAEIELSILNEDGVTQVQKKTIKNSFLKPNKFQDLDKAYEISKQKGAVAITVWEGAHNPIGRAKVLYDIVKSKRPVVLFAYIFGEFGADLWMPMRSLGMHIVLIPYAERENYQAYIQHRNISFDTVWICKHRLHSFELASFITKEDSACILDMDDNEDVFVSSKGSEQKPYGIFSKNKSNFYLGRVKSRSVASISIQQEYGGEIVRHAREKYSNSSNDKPKNTTKTAVFIGTIRAHKNVTQLVDAIHSYNQNTDEKIKLAIGGDFNPPTLRQTLDTPDTIILDEVANEDLFETLAAYDVVITGYPDKRSENSEINKLQITSKIGDGLTIGRPVLTPSSPSVEDLHDVSGLYVFDRSTFNDQLKAAINHDGEINLPDAFTIEKSFETFEALEKLAKTDSKAGDIFELEPFYSKNNKSKTDKSNIVLVWKQHDSGIYGRRVDHLARYYKQKHPDSHVTVIEILDEANLSDFENTSAVFDNSTVIVNDVLSKKIYRYDVDGINYHLLTYKDHDGLNSLEKKFNDFLTTEHIYPDNSVMVLFPLIQQFSLLLESLVAYKVIVDIVDNQVQWMKKPEVRLQGLKQYHELITLADEVVANSPTNLEYFDDLHFFEGKKPHFIANWYSLPSNFEYQRSVNSGEINLIYSGNLNDRIDWDLMAKICKALSGVSGYLHIAGSAVRQSDKMKKLLRNENCIYHGVIGEKNLLRLLQHVNFAVVPHKEDRISKFMDPIKLKMYKKLGITSLTTKLPSLPEDDPMIIVAESSNDFISKLDSMLATHSYKTDRHDDNPNDDVGDKYIKLIDQLIS
ncbi:hypothetical protein OO007_01710 [Cocleimonas sp. KMM 6892]|uniref:hypothetical protein n=1 Tax=unclassified Cocleimonas TaxID=2639732 RepID=UPI002DB84DE0|nr:MULTISPECIES: hypothetical protein [unclassified Cocleimonas]MEB8430924.1 hypothetical protein [Cocleimonas sp. KMM 6892]MEC4714304.1 hypothetical protein [Cocleimonas sp. KMM 6895]MEC4743635.1 hypothetical protein [Cocleimonas sp. KMM 6896]